MAEQSNFKTAGSKIPLPVQENGIVSEPDRNEIIEITVMLRRKIILPPQ
jgi:hypothetical protein